MSLFHFSPSIQQGDIGKYDDDETTASSKYQCAWTSHHSPLSPSPLPPPLVEHQDFDVNSSNETQLPSAPTEQTTPTTPKGSRTIDKIREAGWGHHRRDGRGKHGGVGIAAELEDSSKQQQPLGN